MADLLRIKNDTLNELRNQKYYIQDELSNIINSENNTQKEKVDGVIKISKEIVDINNAIAFVETLFVEPAPAPAVSEPPMPPTEDNGSQPTNVVEAAPAGELNKQGQSHSE